MNRLKSRKFWLTIGSAVALIFSEEFGITIEPELVAGLAGIVLSYNFGQGWVDKTKIAEETRVMGDVTKANAIAYARSLEEKLEAAGRE